MTPDILVSFEFVSKFAFMGKFQTYDRIFRDDIPIYRFTDLQLIFPFFWVLLFLET